MGVIYLTLMPFLIPIPGKMTFYKDPINLIPFIDIISGYDYAWGGVWLNITLFIPFGFFMPVLSRKAATKIVAQGFLLSLIIESMQLIYVLIGRGPFRVFDVTDLITNTCGTFIGLVIYHLLRRLYHLKNND